MRLSFLGGVGTVTGSKYLLEADDTRILIDCGLFQGYKQLRLRNWASPPFEPSGLDAVVLTHAHLDHSGYLPLLARKGFKGPVIATWSTMDLCGVLLPDSGYLQEKDAEYANRHGFSKHKPALPLYTEADARASLDLFRPVAFGRPIALPDGAFCTFHPAGHILGAAILEISWHGRTIVFSGDLGRPDSPVMVPPTCMRRADYLVVESTYGDRAHTAEDVEDQLAEIITRVAGRGGTVIVPAFAVGRSQDLLYHLYRLKKSDRIPDLPIYLDSPMAINASEVFQRHAGEHRLDKAECDAVCAVARYVRDVEESKALDHDPMPKVIVSASGMATGGRVLHHLSYYASDPRNAIVFTGFQAGGTRGANIIAGAEQVKIHGREITVRAEIANLTMLSAHADADEIMDWLGGFERPPERTFVTHGESSASNVLCERISGNLGWSAEVPEHGDTVTL
ncbi:MAG: MBL fold metallo-hydrolase [Rhodospirillaceae bacterium]|nr:MBL fold metallo-hydrolase [Rhodospirillaceae bacterium]